MSFQLFLNNMSYFVYKSYEVVALWFQSKSFCFSLKKITLLYLYMPMYIVKCADSYIYNQRNLHKYVCLANFHHQENKSILWKIPLCVLWWFSSQGQPCYDFKQHRLLLLLKSTLNEIVYYVLLCLNFFILYSHVFFACSVFIIDACTHTWEYINIAY